MRNDETVMVRDMEMGKYEKDCSDIIPEAVQEEFVRVPADLAYWNAKYAVALRVFLKAKTYEKQLEALLSIEHREVLLKNGKATEKAVEQVVNSDERMVEARNSLIDAEVNKVHVWGILDAIRTKKEMLISLGAHIRQEMGDDPTVKAAYADAKRFRESQG